MCCSLVHVFAKVSCNISCSFLLQEKFGDAWTFVATTFLKEIDKNFYEVIILVCLIFSDFCMVIYSYSIHLVLTITEVGSKFSEYILDALF